MNGSPHLRLGADALSHQVKRGAHVVPRGHPKMSQPMADDVRAVVPLCPGAKGCHRLFDCGEVDLLPYLEPAWRDSQEWAAGAVGLATAVRSISVERAL
jgi:hypothetical protein